MSTPSFENMVGELTDESAAAKGSNGTDYYRPTSLASVRHGSVSAFAVWCITGWRLLFFFVVVAAGMAKLHNDVESVPLRLAISVFIAAPAAVLAAYQDFKFRASQAWPATTARDRCYWLPIEEGEEVIRSDLVHLDIKKSGEGYRNHDRLCWLVLTSRRLAFVPADLPGWYQLSYVFVLCWPLLELRQYRLTDVPGFTTWRPKFSLPPMFRLADTEIFFRLVVPLPPWQIPAAVADVEMHFADVEKAWRAAMSELQGATKL